MNLLTRCVLIAALAGLVAATSLPAAITDRYWNNAGTTGSFNDGTNWNIDNPSTGTGPLVTGDTAYIDNGGTANITADVSAIPLNLYLGQAGTTSSGTVNQTAGALTLSHGLGVGEYGGTGAYLLSGGSLTMQGSTDTAPVWYMGAYVDGSGNASTGTMTLTGSAQVNLTTAYTGTGGETVVLGRNTGGHANLTLSGTSQVNINTVNAGVTTSNNYVEFGYLGATTVVTINDTAQLNVTSTGGTYFGDWIGSTTGVSDGSLIMHGGIYNATGSTWIGYRGGNGHVTMDGSASIIQTTGDFSVAYWGTGSTATDTYSSGDMTMSGSATVQVLVGLSDIGRSGTSGTLTMKDGTTWTAAGTFVVGHRGVLANPVAGGPSGTLNIGQGSTSSVYPVINSARFQISNSENNGGSNALLGQTGTVNMTGYAQINATGFDVGDWGYSKAFLYMHDHAQITDSTGAVFIGHYSGADGKAYLYDNAHIEATSTAGLQVANSEQYTTWPMTSGLLEMNQNATINASYVVVGAWANTTGTLTMNDSTSIVSLDYLRVGNYGSGISGTNSPAVGVLNLNGTSTFTAVGVALGSTAGSGGTGTINLNGSSRLTANSVGGTTGGTLKFNGGTLQAGADDPAPVPPDPTLGWLRTGIVYDVGTGAKIDTNSHTVTAFGSLSDPGTAGGGLTVSDSTGSGIGKLILAGNNTYSGMTTINSGTLQIAAAGALPGSATVAASNATLSLAATLSLTGKVFGSAGYVSVDPGANVTYGTNAFSGQITMNGGNMTLIGTHPGTLVVNNGFSWYHNGAGTVSGLTTVGGTYFSSQDALLGGTGTLGNVSVLVDYGNTTGVKGGLEAGQGGIGSLHTANLTFQGAAFLYMGNTTPGAIEAYTSAAGFIAGGTLTLGNAGAGPIVIDMSGANLASHTYHLIQHNGAISYLNGSAITDFSVTNAVLSARQSASIVDNLVSGSTRSLDYVVTGFYPVWKGLIGASTDDTWYQNNTAKTNWVASNNPASSLYFIDGIVPTPRVGDAAMFNDTGAGHTTVSIPLNVAPVTVTVDSTLNYTFNGAGGIVDSTFATAPKTSLLEKNSGTLTINTPNTFSGGTQMADGLIKFGNATALGSGPLSFYSTTATSPKVQLLGYSTTLGGLSTEAGNLSSPVVENGAAGAATLTINNSVANAYTGVLQNGGTGTLAVTFGGTANLTLSGASTYSGDTTFGTAATTASVVLGADNALPSGAGKGNFVFNGGNLDLNGHNQSANAISAAVLAVIANKNTAATNTATLTVGGTNANSSFSGSLLDTTSGGNTGKVALAKVGTGTLILNDPAAVGGAASTYSGGTTLSGGGKIQTAYSSALGTGNLTMDAGTTLDILNGPDATNTSLTVGGLAGDGLVTSSPPGNNAILSLNPAAATSYSFVGVIEDGNGYTSLIKAGAGTQTLGSANTFTGATVVNAGTLQVPVLANGGVTSSIGRSTLVPSSLVLGGGTVYYTGPTVTIDRGLTINGGGIKIDNNLTIQGSVTSTATTLKRTAKTGAGTLTFLDSTGFTTNYDFGYLNGGSGPYCEFWTQQGKTVLDGVTGTVYKDWWYRVGQDPATADASMPAIVGTPELDFNNVTVNTGALGLGYGGPAIFKMTGTASATAIAYVRGGYAGVAGTPNLSMTMRDSSSLTSPAISFGYGTNGVAVVDLWDTASVNALAFTGSNAQNTFVVGANGNGANGTMNLHPGTSITAGSHLYIGSWGTSATSAATGTVTMTDAKIVQGTVTAGTALYVGNSAGGTGYLTVHQTTALPSGSYDVTALNAYVGLGAASGIGTRGTLLMDGYASMNVTPGNLIVAGNGINTASSMTLKDNANITVAGISYMGVNNATSVATVELDNNAWLKSGSTIIVGYNAGTGNLTMRNSASMATTTTAARFYLGVTGVAKGTAELFDSTNITVLGADFLCANGSSAQGTLKLHNDSWVSVATVFYDGNGGAGTIGNVTLDGATAHINAGVTNTLATQNALYVGAGNTASGNLTLNNTTKITANGIAYVGSGLGVGTATLNDSAIFDNSSSISTLRVGNFGGTGNVNVAGVGAQLQANTIQVCYNWSAAVTDNHGTVTVSGSGATVTANALTLGANGGQDGNWNQNAGQTTIAPTGMVYLGEYDFSDAPANRTSGAGTLNLNGGTFTAAALSAHSVVTSTNAADLGTVLHGATAGKVNFNGGTLQASANSSDFIATDDPLGVMTLTVKRNGTTGLGAVIDTQANSVTITKALLHDAAGPAVDGGLKKLGSGTLSLTGAISYTGNTIVNGGTLDATAISTPAASVMVATGATLNSPSVTADSMVIGGGPFAAAAAAVPEPGTLVLLALAGLGVLFAAWRRK